MLPPVRAAAGLAAVAHRAAAAAAAQAARGATVIVVLHDLAMVWLAWIATLWLRYSLLPEPQPIAWLSPEIGVVLAQDLSGPHCTPADALVATQGLVAALEIVDSRIVDWRIRLVDTVADLASSDAWQLLLRGADPFATDASYADLLAGITIDLGNTANSTGDAKGDV